MRILRLEFQNLNSLSGKWEIDFTARDYLADGIFAITGPTGAGKSTILDAISLALYGETPRLRVISKSSNEIMTRGCAKCYAKVVFEVGGHSYIAIWSQKRAHGKEDGRLQDVKRYLDDAVTGKNITDKINDTKKAIEDKIGMNFEQFTRSMLLAQGEFARFLNANSNERANILEKITDVQIYTEISCEVHVRKREMQNRLNILKQGLETFTILSDEDVVVLEKDIARKREEIAVCERQEVALRDSLNYYKRLSELDAEHQSLLEELDNHALQEKEFSVNKQQIQRAEIVADYWSEYQFIVQLRESQEKEQSKLEQQRFHHPLICERLDALVKELDNSKATLKRIHENYQNDEHLIKQVVELDTKIAGLSKTYEQKGEESEALLAEIEDNREQVKDKQALLAQYKVEFESIVEYLEKNQADKEIAREYKIIEDGFNSIHEDRAKIKKLDLNVFLGLEEFEIKKNKFVEISDKYEQVKVNHEEALQKLKGFEKLLDELQGDHETSVLLDELQSKRNRLSLLTSLSERYSFYVSLKNQRKEMSLEIVEINDELINVREKLSQLETQREGSLREVEHLSELVRYAERFMSLQEHRKYLKDGQPCPLCGATEHPYAENEIPDADEYIEKLGEARANLEIIEKGIRKKTNKIIAYEKDVENFGSKIQEKEEQEEELAKELISSLGNFDLLLDDSALTDKLAVKEENLTHAIENLDACILEISKVNKSIDESKKAVNDLQVDMLELSNRVSEKRDSYIQAERDYNIMIMDVERVRDAYEGKIEKLSLLLADFGGYPNHDIKENGEAILNDLKFRESHWNDSFAEKERVGSEIKAVEVAVASIESKIDDWNRLRDKVQDELQEEVNLINKLEEERNILFGNRKVEDVKQMYVEQIAEAERVIAQNEQNVLLAREEQIRIVSLIDSLQEAINSRENEIRQKLTEFKLYWKIRDLLMKRILSKLELQLVNWQN